MMAIAAALVLIALVLAVIAWQQRETNSLLENIEDHLHDVARTVSDPSEELREISEAISSAAKRISEGDHPPPSAT